MAKNTIFIAKRRNERTHVFLSAYRREALPDLDYSFPIDSLDKLLLAQDPESFTYAVCDFHPLSLEPLCKRETKSRPRKQTVREFREKWDNFYENVDGMVLLEEYTGVKEDGTELNRSSLKRAVKEFDALRNDGFLRYLEDNAFRDSDFVIAEPVQDWTTAKAFVSNIILFQAYANDEVKSLNFDEVATHNGAWVFGSAFDKRIKERVKQFTYNPSWRNETVGELLSEANKPDNLDSSAPLLAKYTVWDRHPMNGSKDICRLRNSQHVRLKNSGEIFGEALSFSSKARREVTNRSLYLTADLDCSEREIAQDFVKALLVTTQELESENAVHLGWECNLESAFKQMDRPEVVFHSQWAQLVYDATFHPSDVTAAVCKNCGRPMLNKPGGKPRQFCRPSCKTKYFNNHKAAQDD